MNISNPFNFGFDSPYQPSFDFSLFSIPHFSPLQANEFGAMTSFSANTPTPYVDYSLNQLLGILQTPNNIPFTSNPFPGANPFGNFFQSQGNQGYYDPTQGKVVRGQAPQNTIIVYPSGQLPPELGQNKPAQPTVDSGKRGCNIFDLITGRCSPAINTGSAEGTGPIVGSKPQQNDQEGNLATNQSKTIGQWLNALPSGSGTFVIAIVAIIFLLLFVRR
jgi:hypothetical protein